MNKEKIKEQVLAILNLYYGKNKDLKLPMPVKKIIKSIPNIRLIKYSTYMRDNNLTLEEMISYAGSTDAFTDYDAEHNKYIIAYNDTNENLLRSCRYRWSIAHELGHVVLKHHKNDKTKLFRNSLNEKEYDYLEYEADLFASYILVPYSLLTTYMGNKNELTEEFIKNQCLISLTASKRQFYNYRQWSKNEYSQYDNDLLDLSQNSQYEFVVGTKKFHHKWCKITKNMKFKRILTNRNNIFYLGYEPCKICNS